MSGVEAYLPIRRARWRPAWMLVVFLGGTFGLFAAVQKGFERETEMLESARQQRRQGHLEQAVHELGALAAQLDGRPGAAALQALALRETAEIEIERKQFRKAAAAFEQSLAQDPSPGVVHYELGLAYRELGENRRAAAALQAAIDRGFRNAGVLYNQIHAYFDSRQSTEAVERAKELVAGSPKSSDLMLRLGRLLLSRLYYHEALKAFRNAFESEPNNYEPRFYLALAHYLLNQYPETLAVLTPLTTSAPNSELLSLIASCQAQLGNYDEARKTLRDAMQRYPRSPHAYLNLALIAAEQGDLTEAEALLEQFRALGIEKGAKVFFRISRNACTELSSEARQAGNPAPADFVKATFYFQLAVQMQESYHHASALQLLRVARRYEGKSFRLLYAAGVSCLNLDPQAPEAAALLRDAVTLDPRQHEAWYLLGRAYVRQGNFEDALAAFQKAMSLDRRAAYSIALGKALLSAARDDPEKSRREAKATFEQALALEPANALAHYELGRFSNQIGNFDQARSHLMRAINLEPDFYEAYYLLGNICSRTGDHEQAQKYLAQFERKKHAAMEQSVVGSGFISEGREP